MGKNLEVGMEGMNRKRGTEDTGIFTPEASKIDFFLHFEGAKMRVFGKLRMVIEDIMS